MHRQRRCNCRLTSSCHDGCNSGPHAHLGRVLLVRHWGRIDTQGHRRLDPHPDPGAAINALAALLRAKRRRGYQDRTG
jgi:WGR domain